MKNLFQTRSSIGIWQSSVISQYIQASSLKSKLLLHGKKEGREGGREGKERKKCEAGIRISVLVVLT